jgi:hypothetical protein
MIQVSKLEQKSDEEDENDNKQATELQLIIPVSPLRIRTQRIKDEDGSEPEILTAKLPEFTLSKFSPLKLQRR